MVSPKEHILRIAEDLFFHKGYHPTTTREISDRAQVNVSMINYYFKSKEDLYLAIFNKLENLVENSFDNVTETSNYSGSIKAFVNASLKFAQSEPKLVHLFCVERLHPCSIKIKLIIDRIQQKHFGLFCAHVAMAHKGASLLSHHSKLICYQAIFCISKELIGSEIPTEYEEFLIALEQFILRRVSTQKD